MEVDFLCDLTQEFKFNKDFTINYTTTCKSIQNVNANIYHKQI